MKKTSRILIHFLKLVNFTYFEITIKDRLKLFLNHLRNKLTKNIRIISTKEISIAETYVISLNFRLDRRKFIQKQFVNIPLKPLFIDGTIFDKEMNNEKDFTEKSLRYMSHGAIGCAISHVQLWKKIAAEINDNNYLIFEDDVIFNSNFSKSLHAALRNYPTNTDIFFLGSRNERQRDIKYFTNFNYCRSFNARLGAFAYIISSKSAKKILNTVLPINLLCGGIDTSIGIAIRKNKINAYQIYPSIVYHDNTSLSNIHNPSAKKKRLHSRTVTSWPNHHSRY